MNPRLSSRKFILAALALVSATGFCWFGHISDGVYSTVIVAVCGAYMTANWAVANVKDKP